MDRLANPAPGATPTRDLELWRIREQLADVRRGLEDGGATAAGIANLSHALELVLDVLEDRAFACPRCRRIVPGLALVSCNVGMTRQLPFWACDPCIVDLEQQEAHTPMTIAGYIWDVTLEGPTEGRVDALERRRRAREV
jgi:transcription elongation factor Elf1